MMMATVPSVVTAQNAHVIEFGITSGTAHHDSRGLYLGEENIERTLGLRAVRFCLAEPRLFLTQLRAILRAATSSSIRTRFGFRSAARLRTISSRPTCRRSRTGRWIRRPAKWGAVDGRTAIA
jgi:hypothetical protein